LLSNWKKWKSKEQGGTNRHRKKMAMREEHIIDIALNGENYCSSIHKQQRYFVAGASVRMRGARMFTPQMIAGSMWKEGTYHLFETKETALSLSWFPMWVQNGNGRRMQWTPSKKWQPAD
jgi:hypothetical protein